MSQQILELIHLSEEEKEEVETKACIDAKNEEKYLFETWDKITELVCVSPTPDTIPQTPGFSPSLLHDGARTSSCKELLEALSKDSIGKSVVTQVT